MVQSPNEAPQPPSAKEIAARFISSALLVAMLGFLGWFVWMFSHPLHPSSGQRLRDRDELVNLDQINAVPFVQEVESSPTTASTPLSSRIPHPPPAPAVGKKNRSVPLPPVESQPPDLPTPSRSAKDVSTRDRTQPSTDQGEADSLGEKLVDAEPDQQGKLLEKLRQGKGSEYTQALAAAIDRLSGTAKEKAQQALVDRLTRFTSATLLAYLGCETPQLRRAAALALGNKEDKDHVSELIDLLEDSEPSVVEAAHTALQKLTNRDVEAKKHVAAQTAEGTESREKTAPVGRPLPAAQAKPPVAAPQASKNKQQKNDDVPDVSLVPPEEPSSAVTALIQANTLALSSKSASKRIEAAHVLGGLGEAGKPARRFLCAAMLDPVSAVRVAAADALKNIDPKMHYLAVVLATEKVSSSLDASRIVTLLQKIQKLEEDGEPLAPLVAYVIKFAAGNGTYPLFTTALTTLSRIGRKDLSSYRIVYTALANRDAEVRAIALRGLAGMKHGKLAVPKILALLRIDVPSNRIAAIETLAVLADESTEEIIAAAIAAQRYHDDKEVRTAVETALNKLENKHTP